MDLIPTILLDQIDSTIEIDKLVNISRVEVSVESIPYYPYQDGNITLPNITDQSWPSTAIKVSDDRDFEASLPRFNTVGHVRIRITELERLAPPKFSD